MLPFGLAELSIVSLNDFNNKKFDEAGLQHITKLQIYYRRGTLLIYSSNDSQFNF